VTTRKLSGASRVTRSLTRHFPPPLNRLSTPPPRFPDGLVRRFFYTGEAGFNSPKLAQFDAQIAEAQARFDHHLARRAGAWCLTDDERDPFYVDFERRGVCSLVRARADSARPVIDSRRRGGEQGRIGYGDGGRQIAYPCQFHWCAPHSALLAAVTP
jgi:hypothetical protein